MPPLLLLTAWLVAGRALVSVMTGPSLRVSTSGERWDLSDKVATSIFASRLANRLFEGWSPSLSVSGGIGELCMDRGVVLPPGKLQNHQVHLQSPYKTSHIVGKLQEELGFSKYLQRHWDQRDVSQQGRHHGGCLLWNISSKNEEASFKELDETAWSQVNIGTLTTPAPAGRATQQGTSNPRDFWRTFETGVGWAA